MKDKIYYKIVKKVGEDYHFLFHGINGSKKIEKGTWVKADIKENVIDGKGSSYTSGIHVIEGYNNALTYLNKFKHPNRHIIQCYAQGLKKKEKSKDYVLLANKIKLL